MYTRDRFGKKYINIGAGIGMCQNTLHYGTDCVNVTYF